MIRNRARILFPLSPGWPGWGELDLLDHLGDMAGGILLAGDGGDAFDDVLVVQVVVGVDRHFRRSRLAAGPDHAGDVGPQLLPTVGAEGSAASAVIVGIKEDAIARTV